MPATMITWKRILQDKRTVSRAMGSLRPLLRNREAADLTASSDLTARDSAARMVVPPAPAAKRSSSHPLRKGLVTLALSLLTFYSGSLIVSNYNDDYNDFFMDKVPYSFQFIQLVDTVRYFKERNDLSWNRIKSVITQRTIGIPTHKHERINTPVLPKHLLKLAPLHKLDEKNLSLNDPKLNDIIINLNNIISTINNQNINTGNSDLPNKLINEVVQKFHQSVIEFNNDYTDHINDRITQGTKQRKHDLQRKFDSDLQSKADELEKSYSQKFSDFKDSLEERAAQTLAMGLQANEARIIAKSSNEMALLSIKQVEEFNKIINDKINRERNNKLNNLIKLDNRISKFNATVDNIQNKLIKTTVITKLNSLVNSLQLNLNSYENPSLDINKQIKHLTLLASLLPSNMNSNCKCRSNKDSNNHSSCSCKSCSIEMKANNDLLNVILDELQSITKKNKILSNEQLYNRWLLLSNDFKTTSLLPPNAGVLGHFIAKLFSYFIFNKQGSTINNSMNNSDSNKTDLDSTFSNIKENIKRSKLRFAVEEAVKLNGWPRALCEDWISDARTKLEVQSLLEILNTEIKTL